MPLKIGLFSLENDIGCTSLSMHAANFLSKGDFHVAVIEPESAGNGIFADAQIKKEEDGTFFANKVHYYPKGTTEDAQEEIQVYDFGTVGFLFEFPEGFTKLYLCTKASAGALSEVSGYLTESGTKCEILLLGASKEELSAFKNNGMKCISIGDKKETVCPYDFAINLSLMLRQNGYIPPEYDRHTQFEQISFTTEEPEQKKTANPFASFRIPQKKGTKKEAQKEDSTETENLQESQKAEENICEERQKPDMPVTGNKIHIPVPVPVPVPASSPPPVPVFDFTEKRNEKETDNTESKEYTADTVTADITEQAAYPEDTNKISAPENKKVIPPVPEFSFAPDEPREETREDIVIDVEFGDSNPQEPQEVQNNPDMNEILEDDIITSSFVSEMSESIIVEEKRKNELQPVEVQKKSFWTKLMEKIHKTAESSKQKRNEKQTNREMDALRFKATHDALTGCLNREAFDNDYEEAKVFALICMDVNDLKYANDTFGHKKGDELLLATVGEVKKHFDHVYRIGGDEFNVLIQGAVESEKENIMEKLCKIDEELSKKTKKSRDIAYQISWGVAFSTEGAKKEVLGIADGRMYEDKKNKKSKRQRPLNDIVKVPEITVSNVPAVVKSAPPAVKKKAVRVGHLSAFVTSIRHGCGSSYVAGSLASAMTDIYNHDVYMDAAEETILPDNYMVKRVASKEERFQAYKSGLIVHDRGIYTELTEEDMNDMYRSDLNIMVVTGDESDIRKLSVFIREQGEMAYSWLYVFNHVQEKKKKEIFMAMKGFNTIILPFHDFSEVPASVRKDWQNAIDSCSATL